MKKGKKSLCLAIITVLSLFMLWFSMQSSKAETIRPYNPDQAMSIAVTYDVNQLNVAVIGGGEGYSYQYWIRKKISNPDFQMQYIWQLAKGYSTDTTAAIPVDLGDTDENDRYAVEVSVKDSGGKKIEVLYGSYTPAEVGLPDISEIRVDGKAVSDDCFVSVKGSTLNIGATANIGGLTYSLYLGNSETAITTTDVAAGEKSFSYELDTTGDIYGVGLQKFTLTAENGEGTITSRSFTVYLYGEYYESEKPIITSLTGSSNGQGVTTFIMKVSYADGSAIADADKDKFTYNLTSGSIEGVVESKTVNAIDEMLDVTFTVNYGAGNYGIYFTTGLVSGQNVSKYDDKIIKEYAGYARASTLNQVSTATLNGNRYQSAVGRAITITASDGGITAVNASDLQYAFYREDASGWVLIRSYSSDNQLNWTPNKPGTYNIQARVMDKNAGSYEKAVVKTYVISNASPDGNVTLKIYDNGTLLYDSADGEFTGALEVGRHYKLEACYSGNDEWTVAGGTESMLYRFTLTSANLGMNYLNSFGASPYYLFVPQRPDNYTITIRAIGSGSFGFADISKAQVVVATTLKTAKIQALNRLVADCEETDFTGADWTALQTALTTAATSINAVNKYSEVESAYKAEYSKIANILVRNIKSTGMLADFSSVLYEEIIIGGDRVYGWEPTSFDPSYVASVGGTNDGAILINYVPSTKGNASLGCRVTFMPDIAKDVKLRFKTDSTLSNLLFISGVIAEGVTYVADEYGWTVCTIPISAFDGDYTDVEIGVGQREGTYMYIDALYQETVMAVPTGLAVNRQTGYVTWDNVTGNFGYAIEVDGDTVYTLGSDVNSYYLNSIDRIRIRTLGDGSAVKNSDWSEWYYAIAEIGGQGMLADYNSAKYESLISDNGFDWYALTKTSAYESSVAGTSDGAVKITYTPKSNDRVGIGCRVTFTPDITKDVKLRFKTDGTLSGHLFMNTNASTNANKKVVSGATQTTDEHGWTIYTIPISAFDGDYNDVVIGVGIFGGTYMYIDALYQETVMAVPTGLAVNRQTGYVTWDNVTGNLGYSVEVDGDTVYTLGSDVNSYYLNSIDRIRIRTLGNGSTVKNSDWSEWYYAIAEIGGQGMLADYNSAKYESLISDNGFDWYALTKTSAYESSVAGTSDGAIKITYTPKSNDRVGIGCRVTFTPDITKDVKLRFKTDGELSGHLFMNTNASTNANKKVVSGATQTTDEHGWTIYTIPISAFDGDYNDVVIGVGIFGGTYMYIDALYQ